MASPWSLDYKANDTFAKVHLDPNKYLFIMGCVGSGKSSGCILHIFLNALKQAPQEDYIRRSRYAIIRASYPSLKSTTIDSWKNDWFGPLLNVVYDVPIRGLMTFDHPDGLTKVEIKLVFLALDREEDVNKLQSLQVVGAHLNETAEIPRGVYQMLKSRINRYPKRFSISKIPPEFRDKYKKYADKYNKIGSIEPFIISDYNAVPTEHWLYKIAEEEKPPNHSFYKQPPALIMCSKSDGFVSDAEDNWYKFNPAADNTENLSEDYYIDQVQGADPEWVSVFAMNNYGNLRAGRPVYKMYDDRVNYTEEPVEILKGVPITIGVDTGLNPAAAFVQLSMSGQLIIFDEVCTDDCSIQEFAFDVLRPKLLNEYRGYNYEIIVDPENKRSQTDKKTAKQILKSAGLPVRLGKSQNPTDRREAVVYFLRKKNGLLLTKACQTLRKGFLSEYKYEKVSTTVSGTKWKDKPEKNMASHVHDALQYAALEYASGQNRFKRAVSQSSDYNGPACIEAGY